MIGYMQVRKLSARMGHTADFDDAQLEASLIAGEVIADQLAVPGAHEVGWVFTGTAGMTAKKINATRPLTGYS